MFSRSAMVLAVAVCLVAMASSVSAMESDDMDYDDAVKILKQLERYYATVARPRLGRSENVAVTAERRSEGLGAPAVPADQQQWAEPALPRAVRLLQLHSLDRYYTHQNRPRFGKRSFTHAAVAPKDNPMENRLEKLLGLAQTR